jgi:hypothetical protein
MTPQNAQVGRHPAPLIRSQIMMFRYRKLLLASRRQPIVLCYGKHIPDFRRLHNSIKRKTKARRYNIIMCDKLKKEFCKIAKGIIAKYQTIYGSIDYKKKPVPDQYVALIEVALSQGGGQLKYIEEAITDASKRDVLHKKLIKKAGLPTIALVLESPHIHEYDNGILCPLISSSDNVQQAFLQLLLRYLMLNNNSTSAFISNRQKLNEGNYKLLFINPIQYQCSLGQSGNNAMKTIKEPVFTACWENELFKNNFIERLQNYHPTMIINCCTGIKDGKPDGLQKLVQQEINSHFNNAVKLFGYHPSSCHFLRGFDDCKD